MHGLWIAVHIAALLAPLASPCRPLCTLPATSCTRHSLVPLPPAVQSSLDALHAPALLLFLHLVPAALTLWLLGVQGVLELRPLRWAAQQACRTFWAHLRGLHESLSPWGDAVLYASPVWR